MAKTATAWITNAVAALSLSELQALRDDLVRSLARGERRVRDQNGEEIEYRSAGEMQRAIAALERRIAAMQSGAANAYRFSTNKGV